LGGILVSPRGGIDLHRQVINYRGLLLAGIEGSLRYRDGPYQYSQWEMWTMVFSLAPRLMLNRIRYGRFLDIFVTHASPWGIHDLPDLTHQGIKAFRWFLRVFKPALHIHGHIHVYRPDTITETMFEKSRVINTFGYRSTPYKVPDGGFRKRGGGE
jgi:Icc-related predicted phosphoesterase